MSWCSVVVEPFNLNVVINVVVKLMALEHYLAQMSKLIINYYVDTSRGIVIRACGPDPDGCVVAAAV